MERRALDRTQHQLDVQTIIKRQLRLERIIRVLFGSKQRYLLRVLERKEELLESGEEDHLVKEMEFDMDNLKDLHGKLKEINLKTYVGNKLIKALLARNKDII